MIRRTATALAVATTLALAPPAGAQHVDPTTQGGGEATGPPTGLTPPAVEPVGERSPIFRYAVLFVLVGAAIGVVVIPGKRSHQD